MRMKITILDYAAAAALTVLVSLIVAIVILAIVSPARPDTCSADLPNYDSEAIEQIIKDAEQEQKPRAWA